MRDGAVYGRIVFRDPAVYGAVPLDFDPRGQLIELRHGDDVILQARFTET
jgi:hypothetical protein